MRIDVDDYLPKLAVGHRRSITSSPFHQFMIIDVPSRNSNFSYTKLPEEPLKLSVLKLDGSYFDIEIMKSATIADLRQAVEAVFSHMPQKGPGKISWPHLWSHFCLTYDGRKLLTETDYIRNYGIKDGDKLHFVRHISTSYNSLRKKRTIKQIATPQQHKISVSQPNIYKMDNLNGKEENCYDLENGVCNNYYSIDIFKQKEPKLVGFFQRWYQLSKMQSKERRSKGSSSRSAYSFLTSFKKIMQFNGDNQHPQRRGLEIS